MLHVDRHIAIWAGWVAGPAFGVAMMAAPEYLKMQPSVAAMFFWAGIIVFVVTIFMVISLSVREQERRHKAMWPILTMAAGVLIFGVGAAGFFWPSSVLSGEASKAPEQQQHPMPGSPDQAIPNRTDRFGDLAVLPNKELRRLTSQFANEMRVFEENLKTWDVDMPTYPSGATQEQKNTIWAEHSKRILSQTLSKITQFRNTIYLDMMALHQELTRRLQQRGILLPRPQVMPALKGELAGPHPIADVADFLEGMARKLPD